MAKLEFGIWDRLGLYEMSQSPLAADIYEKHIQEAQMAEELGYASYFIIEHQNSHTGQITAPNVYLSAVAQRTSTIRIGVMIYQLPLHHPMRLAEETAMLDHLSRGRLEFGAGHGTSEHEFIRWNTPFAERRAMGNEALDIILKAWTQDSVTYEGNYWKFDEALPVPKPYQKPHPPIWYAAHSTESLEYAAKHNFNVSLNLDVDEVIAEKLDLYRRVWRECDHPEPMPRAFLMRPVHVAETDEKARAEAEQPLLEHDSLARRGIAQTRIGYKGNPDTVTRNARARGTPEQKLSYDWWIDSGSALVGSPETVRRKLEEHQRTMGYDVLCAAHQIGAMPYDLVLNSLKLLGEEVIPAFS